MPSPAAHGKKPVLGVHLAFLQRLQESGCRFSAGCPAETSLLLWVLCHWDPVGSAGLRDGRPAFWGGFHSVDSRWESLTCLRAER